MEKINITELVKGNTAKFVSYREGNFVYEVKGFEFNVPLEDIKGATLNAEEKAIFFMRWIRQHIQMMEKNISV